MSGFYAIVDPAACAGRDPVVVAEAILHGGCAMLQLRSKALDDAAYLGLARALHGMCGEKGVPFVVNDRADVAAIVGVHGLHLGQGDLPIADARKVVGSMAVGLSSHDLDQARLAAASGADIVAFGPVFETTSKHNPDPVVGLDQLGAVVRAVRRPVVAIGGMTVERAALAKDAGATYVAAIGAVCAAPDPARAAAAMHRAAGGAL